MDSQFTQTNQPQRWDALLKRSSWSLLSLVALFYPLKGSPKEWAARVRRGTVATLLARAANNRNYAGLVAVALAPFAESLFRLFDSKAGGEADYWNAYFFLHATGPHFSTILIVTGFFILMPTVNRLRFAAILPVSYKMAKIIWLASITSNAGYHAFVPWSFLLMGFSTAILWFMLFDWLMSLHFHKREGTIARIIGIINCPGVSAEEKVGIAKLEIENLNSHR